MTRKSFIQRVLKYWTAISSLPVVYGIISYLTPPKPPDTSQLKISAGKRDEYTPGSIRMIRDGKTAVIVKTTASGQIRSFSAKCTHLGCIVELQEEEDRIRCNCHGSIFDMDGNNVTGPATKPLEPYRVEIKNGEVVVSRL